MLVMGMTETEYLGGISRKNSDWRLLSVNFNETRLSDWEALGNWMDNWIDNHRMDNLAGTRSITNTYMCIPSQACQWACEIAHQSLLWLQSLYPSGVSGQIMKQHHSRELSILHIWWQLWARSITITWELKQYLLQTLIENFQNIFFLLFCLDYLF